MRDRLRRLAELTVKSLAHTVPPIPRTARATRVVLRRRQSSRNGGSNHCEFADRRHVAGAYVSRGSEHRAILPPLLLRTPHALRRRYWEKHGNLGSSAIAIHTDSSWKFQAGALNHGPAAHSLPTPNTPLVHRVVHMNIPGASTGRHPSFPPLPHRFLHPSSPASPHLVHRSKRAILTTGLSLN